MISIQIHCQQFCIVHGNHLDYIIVLQGVNRYRTHQLIAEASTDYDFQTRSAVHIGILHNIEGTAIARNGGHQSALFL